MKICFISFTYYPNLDGVQNVTTYQAEGLAKLGHEVTVITASVPCTLDDEQYNGVHIIRLPIQKMGLWAKGNKAFTRRMLLEICNQQDVIIDVCYFDFLSQQLVPLLSKITCRKFCMMHGTWEYAYTSLDRISLKNFARKTLQNFRWKFYFKRNEKNYRRFDGIFHLHEADKSIVYSKQIGFSRDHVLVNAVDEIFFLKNADCGMNNSPLIFIQVANYSFLKNQLIALRAFYAAKLPLAELWMIGSQVNGYYKNLVEDNKKLSLGKDDKVKLFVNLSRKETIEKIKQANVIVLSSLSEHLPVTILEGLAAGLPYISTDVGVVHNIPGGIVCKTEAELTKAMKKLYEDTTLRKKLAEDGYAYADRNCHINAQVNKMEGIIKNA